MRNGRHECRKDHGEHGEQRAYAHADRVQSLLVLCFRFHTVLQPFLVAG